MGGGMVSFLEDFNSSAERRLIIELTFKYLKYSNNVSSEAEKLSGHFLKPALD